MNKINKMRARLLHDKFGSDAASSFGEMINEILKTPSYIGQKCCSTETESSPILKLNTETFNNNFANMAQAIHDNFPQPTSCAQCKKTPDIIRTFQPQILVEVKFLLIKSIP